VSVDDDRTDIEKAFEESWWATETLFAYYIIIHKSAYLVPFFHFLFSAHHAYGDDYARKLRAGQQLRSLILSRSREHGLRSGQHRMFFDVVASEGGDIKAENRVKVTYYGDNSSEEIVVDMLVSEDMQIVEDVKGMLDRLVEQPID
jgi:hypothetical protein